jgi:GntR family transcriptional regulator, sialic acid-inducible nan operon repressor
VSEVIQRRKLFHEVADRLQDLILSGGLQVGEALPSERELMERYGVGRPAIREALLSLERAGLISISGGERARVARPSARGMVAGLDPAVRHWLADPAGVRHLQAARLLLEVGLVREAVRTATEAEIGRLHEALLENEASRGDLARFERTDVAFHYVFAEISGNPIFTAIHQAMVGWLTEQRTITLRAPGAEEHAALSHRRIYEAVAARDADAAEAEMRAHLREVAQLYWRTRELEAAR